MVGSGRRGSWDNEVKFGILMPPNAGRNCTESWVVFGIVDAACMCGCGLELRLPLGIVDAAWNRGFGVEVRTQSVCRSYSVLFLRTGQLS